MQRRLDRRGDDLNRETARRRVEALIREGALIRTGSGDIALPPERVQERSALDLVRRQLDAVVRFTNDCLRDRVLIARSD